MPNVLRIAVVDPNDSTRERLKTALLGLETVWLEAECSRYAFFVDVIEQTKPDIGFIAMDSDPQRAVKLTSDGATVLVVGAKNLVEVRKVKLGTMQGDKWAILDGLKPGERVIVDGQQKAVPGQPVRIAKPRPAGVPPSAARPATRPAVAG